MEFYKRKNVSLNGSEELGIDIELNGKSETEIKRNI